MEYPVKKRISKQQFYCRKWLKLQGNYTVKQHTLCSICLASIQVNQVVYNLTCFNQIMWHPLHKECMEEYMVYHLQVICPVCQFEWQ